MEATLGTFRGKTISVDADHERAIQWLAAQDGHRNASRVIQRLIEREMGERFGARWRERLRERVAQDEAAA